MCVYGCVGVGGECAYVCVWVSVYVCSCVYVGYYIITRYIK